MDSIDVIIPIFNRKDYTEFLLNSLDITKHGHLIRPILVDNASRQGVKNLLKEWVQKKHSTEISDPIVIELSENRGFAGAINAAIKDSLINLNKEVLCILHNDTMPFDGWIKELYDCYCSSDEEVAILIPMTNYANESSTCVPFIRESFEKIKPSNKNRMLQEEIFSIINNLYPSGQSEVLKYLKENNRKTFYCPEISSFCMLIKTQMFINFGNFDEDFWPRTYEDKFWFFKIQREGFCCQGCSYSYVHHFGNITSDGPGFCFPDMAKRNEEKYKEKIKIFDENKIKQIINELPRQ